MKPAEIIEAHFQLLRRAVEVAGGAPYWQHGLISGEAMRLDCNPERPNEIGLLWCDDETSWDVTTLETREFWFPIELLAMPEGEFKAWKAEQRRLYDEKQERQDAERRKEAENREHAEYLRLKAKYEGSQ